MKVCDVMSRPVLTVSAEVPLQEAAVKMEQFGVGALPVVRDGWPVGIVTDRDLAVRGIGRALPAGGTPVSAVMTHEVAYCFGDQSTDEALRLMQENGVRRLVVIDGSLRMVGLLSLDDLIAWPQIPLGQSPVQRLPTARGKEEPWTQ